MLFKSVKLVSLMIIAVLVIGITVGCSSNKGSSTDTVSTTDKTEEKETASADNNTSTKKVEIVFWHNWQTGPSGESMKQSVEQFNKTHDNIEVKPLYVATDGGDSITSKLITAVAGGNPPNAMLASRYGVAEYMDAVTVVNDLAAKDGIDQDSFSPWAWDEASYEGQLLGLPYDGTARALFYNKDHFKAAGLDPENPPKTIQDMEEAAKKLTIKEGNRYKQFGLIPWYGEGWLYTWGWAFGGSFYDKASGKVTANDPKIVETLEWETKFAEQFGIQDVTSFVSSAGTDANNPFISGQLSMMINGNWMLAQIKQYNPNLNFGVTYIPTPTGDNFTTFVGGRVILIPKGVKNLNESWEFVKWMCASEEGQSIKKITGEFAAMPSVNEKLYSEDPLQEKFIEVLPNGRNRPVILAGNMMWDELAKAPDMVMNKKGTAKEILDQITDKINKEIENKKAQLNK